MASGGAQLRVGHVSVGAFSEAAMSKGRERQFVTQAGSTDDFLYDAAEIIQVAAGRNPRERYGLAPMSMVAAKY
jgi:hypothetical protein